MDWMRRAPGIVLDKSVGEKAVRPKDGETYHKWEKASFPWHCLKGLLQALVKKLVLLGLIVWNVTKNKDHLMHCSLSNFDEPWPFGKAMFCEWTKAFVRCMPIMAILLTLLVSVRLFIFERIFYQCLKRGGLLVFELFNFHHDPDYVLMIFAISQAALHYVFLTYYEILDEGHGKQKAQQLAQKEKLQELQSHIAFYMIPTWAFWGLFCQSYDVASMTMPILKYYEENPEEARECAAKSKIIRERGACLALQRGVGGYDTDTVYARFIDKAAFLSRPNVVNYGPPVLSNWRLMTTWWPAKVLFDPRLDDSDSRQFRYAFYVLTFFCFLVFGCVCYLLEEVFVKKYKDVVFEGEKTDIPGLLVVTFFVIYAVRVFYKLINQTVMVSFRAPAMPMDDDSDDLRDVEDEEEPESVPLLKRQSVCC